MQKARRHPSRGSDRLRARGFRSSFTPLSGVLFTFPSRYLSTIGLPGVLSLGGWCRQIRTGFLRPRPTQVPARVGGRSGYGAVTRYGPPFQTGSPTLSSSTHCRPYNPARASTPAVWALPLSLAATRGVTVVFLSSAYLDVSVRRVRHPSKGLSSLPLDGLPHSDTRGSSAVRASPRLFAACRVLPRLREPRHPPRALDYLSRASRPSRRHHGAGHLSILALYFFPSDCFLLSFHHVKDRSTLVGQSGEQGIRTLDPQLAELVL